MQDSQPRSDHIYKFLPFRKKGIWIYILGVVLTLAGFIVSLNALFRVSGGAYVVFLALFLVCLISLPMAGYALYGLLKAVYLVSRDGVLLRWGMREIYLPMTEIEWVRTYESMGLEMRLPSLSWSGILRGRSFTRELGSMEFLATEPTQLVLIATAQSVYAVSPADQIGFIRSMQTALESGSISPVAGYAVEPFSFFNRLWEDRTARTLAVAGVVFNIALLAVIQLIIPQEPTISLGFTPGGSVMPALPTTNLRLLSLLSLMFAFLDVVLGINFYRVAQWRHLAYLLWSMMGLLPFLLILAIGIAI